MTEPKTTAAQRKAVKKYKEKVNRITVDFYPSEESLWQHIQNQPKKQTYIKNLIRSDIEVPTQGYWKTNPLIVGGECSVCGWSFEWFENDEAHYCPHCGAKMNKGEA